MVVIDTDVLLLAFAFQNDKRQPTNTAFLKRVQTADPAITVYNLMELLGQLSFNLSPARLDAWQSWLIEAHRLTVIWPLEPDELSAISFRIVTWNARHFKAKSTLTALTPEEYLAQVA